MFKTLVEDSKQIRKDQEQINKLIGVELDKAIRELAALKQVQQELKLNSNKFVNKQIEKTDINQILEPTKEINLNDLENKLQDLHQDTYEYIELSDNFISRF
jgi:hypothetical protein